MSPSDYLHRYIRVAEVILVLLALCFVAWEVHQFAEHERDIGRKEVQALWDAQTARDKLARAADEARWAKNKSGAEDHATDRQQINDAARAAAGAVAGSLRNAIAAAAAPRSDDTAATARKDAATLGALLADCEGRYRGMAALADGHASDVKMLIEAWPAAPIK